MVACSHGTSLLLFNSIPRDYNKFIAELAERSPIIIKNSSNPSSRKNVDVRPSDRTTVQGATFNMRGQLTPRRCSVVQWSVHWAPRRTTRVLVLAGAKGLAKSC